MAEGRENVSDCFLIWQLHQATSKTRKRNTKYIFAYTRRGKEKLIALAFGTLESSRIEGSDAKKGLKTQGLLVRLYWLDSQVLFPKETKKLPFSKLNREINTCLLSGNTERYQFEGYPIRHRCRWWKSSYWAVGLLSSSFLCPAVEKRKKKEGKQREFQ